MKRCDKDAASVFIQDKVLSYCQIIFVSDCLQSVKKYTRLVESSSVSRNFAQLFFYHFLVGFNKVVLL